MFGLLHNTLVFALSKNFPWTIDFKSSLEDCLFLSAFENNNFCKMLGQIKQSVLWWIRK